MKRHSTAALLGMCLVAWHQASPHPLAAADLYIDIDGAVEQRSSIRNVDVVVGNRGGATNHENFDALIEVQTKDGSVCHASTNFVTPIGPGQLIRALRFELRPSDSQALERFTVRASIRYWDHTRSGLQEEARFALPPGRGRCIALKPLQ